MNAEAIAKALGAHRTGTTWMARCPAHDDRSPSLAICERKVGKVLVHCHAGCEQRDVIAQLKAKGLWIHNSLSAFRYTASRRVSTATMPNSDDIKRNRAAVAIWRASQGVAGSPAHTYLRSRGILIAAPPSLRIHPGLKHPSGGVWPAMVALVVSGETGLPMAVHRTFLTHDGQGKAPVDPPKMMLAPCRGGVVRLAEAHDKLMVGEGIETCLSAMQATGNPAWAALSTSGLRSLNLPRSVHDVIVLADGDEPGEAAAQDCANRWRREGRHVRIARPPRGLDFNDMLMGRVPFKPEGAS